MKKGWLYGALAGFLFLAGCGSSMTVVEYNDSFIAVVNDCLNATQPFWDEFEGGTSDLAVLQDDIKICEKSSKDASNLGNFDGDSSLKDAVVSFLTAYVEYLDNFTESSKYRNIDDIAIEDEENYRALVKSLSAHEENLNIQMSSLQEVQEIFAAKHGLKLE